MFSPDEIREYDSQAVEALREAGLFSEAQTPRVRLSMAYTLARLEGGDFETRFTETTRDEFRAAVALRSLGRAILGITPLLATR